METPTHMEASIVADVLKEMASESQEEICITNL